MESPSASTTESGTCGCCTIGDPGQSEVCAVGCIGVTWGIGIETGVLAGVTVTGEPESPGRVALDRHGGVSGTDAMLGDGEPVVWGVGMTKLGDVALPLPLSNADGAEEGEDTGAGGECWGKGAGGVGAEGATIGISASDGLDSAGRVELDRREGTLGADAVPWRGALLI
jgi:hypothetical protein